MHINTLIDEFVLVIVSVIYIVFVSVTSWDFELKRIIGWVIIALIGSTIIKNVIIMSI